MYFKKGKSKIITATMQDGLYVITHIDRGYQDEALYGHGYHDTAFSGTNGTTDEITVLEKKKYILWHRHFNHLGPDEIRNLHKVTNPATLIKVPNNIDICEVCVLTKMTNRIPCS
jgi:hypothetical protein